ncbi:MULTISPECIES: hypothetical protein [Ensifer]|uniref:hypothetical protein n=1 Tax=Ensifer TaxID=106591 RepID=UPI000DC21CB3|nr:MULTISPECIES: hypothetical protein [Ensifer]MCY1745085.1 hypothetical protein [Ensifer sp. SL37]RAS02271.1 hypothetical protein DEU52_13317 [Ensifer adhaerens]UTV40672.1 hypothetical protein MYG64_33270 [Ensifer adhaerens]
MKPQQRKFIVEVKSARRRSTTSQSSIWGDTDLKALVRAAETEAPHLFEPAQRIDLPSPETTAEVLPNEDAAIEAAAPIADPANPTEGGAGSEDTSGPSLIPPLEVDRPKANSQKMTPKRQGSRRGRPSGIRTVIVAPEAIDDLAALQEENRRLKAMLAERLRQENILLQKMLERFETN